ncbi:MAG: hypothetical protein NWF06_05300 [Candidatus Bathyarchaeota archaeon]|nr:hypothetical protein [Candidatus Bathyarchaeum sp.]
MIDDEIIQLIEALGLNYCEAKVYCALVKLGEASAKEISQMAHVARSDSYRLLTTLCKKGLVEKIIGTPNRFKAAPIQEGLQFLLEKSKQKNLELQTKIKSVLNKNRFTNNESLLKDETNFIMVPESAFVRKAKKVLDNNTSTVDIIASRIGATIAAFDMYETFMKALERGVKIRIINEELERELKAPKILQALRSPNLKLKYVRYPLRVELGIHDDKAVLACCETIKNKTFPCSIWTNNPCFVTVFRDYFEKIWKQALEYKNQ